MDAASVADLCRTLPGATESIQWENDRVFKVGGKMFCCMGTSREARYSFKVDPDRFLELTDHPGIHPAPYLARARWVQIEPDGCLLDESEIAALVRDSYARVRSGLPKRVQAELVEQ